MVNLAPIKKKLLQRKQELEEALSLVYKDNPANDQVQDTGDQATSSSLEELKISLHNNEQNEYKMVIKALQLIEEGAYGLCIDCGSVISEKRLTLFPNSTRCLSCQEIIEEKG